MYKTKGMSDTVTFTKKDGSTVTFKKTGVRAQARAEKKAAEKPVPPPVQKSNPVKAPRKTKPKVTPPKKAAEQAH